MGLTAEELFTQAWQQRKAALERGRPLTEFRIHPEDYYTIMAWKPASGFNPYLSSYLNPGPIRLMGIPIVVTTDTDPLTPEDIPWKGAQDVYFFKRDEHP